MWAKAETALRVDDGKKGESGHMDKAIYNFMDNVSTLNIKNAWKDIKNITHLALHEERDIISREGGVGDSAPRVKGEINIRGDAAPPRQLEDKPSYVIDAKTVGYAKAHQNDNQVQHQNDNASLRVASNALVRG